MCCLGYSRSRFNFCFIFRSAGLCCSKNLSLSSAVKSRGLFFSSVSAISSKISGGFTFRDCFRKVSRSVLISPEHVNLNLGFKPDVSFAIAEKFWTVKLKQAILSRFLLNRLGKALLHALPSISWVIALYSESLGRLTAILNLLVNIAAV